MWSCSECELTFDSFQAKANHVRWKHKSLAYSEDGLKRIQENARQTAIKRYGDKTIVTEERTCICGTKFTVTYSPERKNRGKKTCSRACGAKRNFSFESNEKRRQTLSRLAAERPEIWMKGIQAMFESLDTRSSSKAERALAEALRPLGFKRHKQVAVDGLTFDVDIVSLDGTVWVESDGEWHFRQVHEGHDYQKTRLRDDVEEREAIRRNVLLVRVNNQTTSTEEQVAFIATTRSQWDGKGCVKRLGYS